MRKKHLTHLFILCVAYLCLSSCSPVPEQGVTLSEASKKFLQMSQEDFQYNVKLKHVGETIWIYLPIEESIIVTKADKDGKSKEKKSEEGFSIRYLDGNFKDNNFIVDYDIGPSKSYAVSQGYTSSTSEAYQKRQRNLLGIFQRTYFDVGHIEGDIEFNDKAKDKSHDKLVDAYVKTDVPPKFIVIIIADIVNGMEIETLYFFEDLKKAFSSHTPFTQEEFFQRTITDLRGTQDAIGDKEGAHIEFRNITMKEFLSRQIVSRINFKYNQSSFPPSENTRKEFSKIIANTLRFYGYDDLSMVDFHDLNLDEMFSYSSDEVKALGEDPKKKNNKLHVIKFRN